MATGRVVAAADLSAAEAHPEMHPPTAGLQALLAAEERIWQLGDANAVVVRTGLIHGPRLLSL